MAHDPNNIATWSLQEKAKRLWQIEGGHCVSSLVHTLAQGFGAITTPDGARSDALGDMIEQAFELSTPLDDWEEAAREAGWIKFSDTDWRPRSRTSMTERQPSAQEACEANGIEPHQREVLEHWLVSDWLADKLAERGEKIDKDFAGLTIWARTTTGQAVYCDHVIEQIAAATYGREG